MTASSDRHDAVVVGASLAGCTTAILLARTGASVLLVEKQPALDAHKVVCGHYIQSSALPVIERLGLLEPMLEAGAVFSAARLWFEDGEDARVIGPVEADVVEPSINLPRRKLDPLLRGIAAETPGVELRMGTSLESVESLGSDGCRVTLRDGAGSHASASARVLVGADGRDSAVARFTRSRTARASNGRFNYSPFYSGPPPPGFPATTSWFIGDQWAGAFPTADGLTGYYLMPTHDRLPEFKRDLEGACLRMIAGLPEPPDVDQLELAGPIVGKLDLSFQWRNPARAGMALVGDAAFSVDPLYGVGCGWAFESGALLADALGASLSDGAPTRAALRGYRRKVTELIVPHTLQMLGYSRGRALARYERFVMRRAARDPAVEQRFIEIVTRNIRPPQLAAPREVAKLLRA